MVTLVWLLVSAIIFGYASCTVLSNNPAKGHVYTNLCETIKNYVLYETFNN